MAKVLYNNLGNPSPFELALEVELALKFNINSNVVSESSYT